MYLHVHHNVQGKGRRNGTRLGVVGECIYVLLLLLPIQSYRSGAVQSRIVGSWNPTFLWMGGTARLDTRDITLVSMKDDEPSGAALRLLRILRKVVEEYNKRHKRRLDEDLVSLSIRVMRSLMLPESRSLQHTIRGTNRSPSA